MIDTVHTRPARRLFSWLAPAVTGLTLLAVLSGCGSSTTSGGTSSLHSLTIGLTYVPNIQFAPFYVAEALGYYKADGLAVTLRHQGVSEGEFNAIAAGQEDAIFAGGDEVLQAASRGISLTYVAEVYTQYPVAVIVPAGSAIHSAADLRGRTIGIPGLYGTSYIALLALLRSAGLSQSDVNIQAIGYTQPEALIAHKVDAVVDYVNDNPALFKQHNFATRTLGLQQPIVSDGIAIRNGVLKTRPIDIRALIKATLQGVAYTIANPQKAVELSGQYIPGLNDPQTSADALATLQATIPLWQRSDGKPLGYTDLSLCQAMNTFLQGQGQLTHPVDASTLCTNAYLPS